MGRSGPLQINITHYSIYLDFPDKITRILKLDPFSNKNRNYYETADVYVSQDHITYTIVLPDRFSREIKKWFSSNDVLIG